MGELNMARQMVDAALRLAGLSRPKGFTPDAAALGFIEGDIAQLLRETSYKSSYDMVRGQVLQNLSHLWYVLGNLKGEYGIGYKHCLLDLAKFYSITEDEMREEYNRSHPEGTIEIGNTLPRKMKGEQK